MARLLVTDGEGASGRGCAIVEAEGDIIGEVHHDVEGLTGKPSILLDIR
jgi:hypothetical protein